MPTRSVETTGELAAIPLYKPCVCNRSEAERSDPVGMIPVRRKISARLRQLLRLAAVSIATYSTPVSVIIKQWGQSRAMKSGIVMET